MLLLRIRRAHLPLRSLCRRLVRRQATPSFVREEGPLYEGGADLENGTDQPHLHPLS